MIPAEKMYAALFSQAPFADNESVRFPVIAWDDKGYALIVDDKGGKLVIARDLRGFERVERISGVE
jgi:hypothetical protein